MKAINLTLVSAFFLYACSNSEPAATAYKKSLASQTAGSGNQTGQSKTPDTKSGSQGSDTNSPAASGGGDVAKGKAFFLATPSGATGCSGCHGADGKGATPLSDPGNYTDLTPYKSSSPAHSRFPTAAADVKDLLAFLNSLTL